MSEVSPENLITPLSFCVIDLETTGGNYQKDKIIEVGMVNIKGLKVEERKSFLVNPQMHIPEFIQKLTNISQKDVADAPIIEDVIDEILEFIGDDIIVAHNTSFDVPFLNGTLKNLKRPELQNKVICTNVMTKHLIPDILNSNLTYMSRLFKIEHSKAHRAEDDALATAKLLIIYLKIFIEKGIKKVNQLYYPRNKFELDRIHLDEQYKSSEVIDIIKNQSNSLLMTIKGERGLILAVLPIESPNEESEFIESILSKLDWKIITIKLLEPMIEGIFQFSNHFLKYPEDIRYEVLNYLKNRYKVEKADTKLDQIDFLIAHHLIEDQVIAYSFLNLNTNRKSLFKIPAQKKKLLQHLASQISRFEKIQKGSKKNLLNPEIVPLVESFLEFHKKDQSYLYISRKDIKNSKESCIRTVEKYVSEHQNKTNFPIKHL